MPRAPALPTAERPLPAARLSLAGDAMPRIDIYRKIESLRQRPLIVLATSQRSHARGLLGVDCADELHQQLILLAPTAGIDLLIQGAGGYAGESQRLADLIREYTQTFDVLIGGRAPSEFTALACAAQNIVMTRGASLGPTDAQFDDFGEETLRYLSKLLRTLKVAADQRAEYLLKPKAGVDNADLGTLARAADASKAWLTAVLTRRFNATKARRLVRLLTRGHVQHDTSIYRTQAKAMGLQAVDASAPLESLLTEVSADISAEFKEEDPFFPLAVTFDDPTACRIGHVPMSKPSPVTHATKIVESVRLARYKETDFMIYVQAEGSVPTAHPVVLRERWQSRPLTDTPTPREENAHA